MATVTLVARGLWTLAVAGLGIGPGVPALGGPPLTVRGPSDPVPTESWVGDWDLPGMKVVYVKSLAERPIEVTSYTLTDCRNVGLIECETEIPAGRTVQPGQTIELVVVGPILSSGAGPAPPVSFRYTYTTRLR